MDCYFFSPDSGFVVGSTNGDNFNGYTRILFTSDGGNSWTIRHAGNRSGELCWKIQFRTKKIGYVSIENFSRGPTYYLKTTDAGLTWSDQLFRNSEYDVQGIGFFSDSLGWMGGWGGNTYETTDAGVSWHLAGFGYYVNRFQFVNDTLAYAVGETVYKGLALCTSKAGDADGDGDITFLDIIFTVNYVFKAGTKPDPICRSDANASGNADLTDIIYQINYIFRDAPAPEKIRPCCL